MDHNYELFVDHYRAWIKNLKEGQHVITRSNVNFYRLKTNRTYRVVLVAGNVANHYWSTVSVCNSIYHVYAVICLTVSERT